MERQHVHQERRLYAALPDNGGCDSTVTRPWPSTILRQASSVRWLATNISGTTASYTTSGDYAALPDNGGLRQHRHPHLTVGEPVSKRNPWNYQRPIMSGMTAPTPRQGDYVPALLHFNGFDSMVTLHLVVNNPVKNEINQWYGLWRLCLGQCYLYQQCDYVRHYVAPLREVTARWPCIWWWTRWSWPNCPLQHLHADYQRNGFDIPADSLVSWVWCISSVWNVGCWLWQRDSTFTDGCSGTCYQHSGGGSLLPVNVRVAGQHCLPSVGWTSGFLCADVRCVEPRHRVLLTSRGHSPTALYLSRCLGVQGRGTWCDIAPMNRTGRQRGEPFVPSFKVGFASVHCPLWNDGGLQRISDRSLFKDFTSGIATIPNGKKPPASSIVIPWYQRKLFALNYHNW